MILLKNLSFEVVDHQVKIMREVHLLLLVRIMLLGALFQHDHLFQVEGQLVQFLVALFLHSSTSPLDGIFR